MGKIVNDPPSETVHLLERLRSGDRRALADLFQRHRDRLRRKVELRMDARLYGRIDASDVLQDGFLDVANRVESYLTGTEEAQDDPGRDAGRPRRILNDVDLGFGTV